MNMEGLKQLTPIIKILFGWGQILSSFNLTFNIKWPVEFDSLMTFMYAPFNVDLFSLFKDFGCYVDSSYVASFYMHMLMLPLLIVVILSAWATAHAYKAFMCCKLCKPHYDNKTLYARALKMVNLVVFIMYPGIGLRVFRVFALSCFNPKLREPLDENVPEHLQYTETCEPGGRFMTSDLSVKESSEGYQTMRGFAYLFIFLYVIGIPMLYMYILYSKRKIIALDPEQHGEATDPKHHREIVACRMEFGSLYKDYKRKYYWFELVEMGRKIILVGALVMLGSSGMQIFAGIVICFFYVLLASYIEPLTSKTGQMLQYVTSIQLFCTLISGLMITHRTYEREKGIGNEAQDVALAVWLMFSTIVVFIAIVLVVGSVMLILKSLET